MAWKLSANSGTVINTSIQRLVLVTPRASIQHPEVIGETPDKFPRIYSTEKVQQLEFLGV